MSRHRTGSEPTVKLPRVYVLHPKVHVLGSHTFNCVKVDRPDRIGPGDPAESADCEGGALPERFALPATDPVAGPCDSSDFALRAKCARKSKFTTNLVRRRSRNEQQNSYGTILNRHLQTPQWHSSRFLTTPEIYFHLDSGTFRGTAYKHHASNSGAAVHFSFSDPCRILRSGGLPMELAPRKTAARRSM